MPSENDLKPPLASNTSQEMIASPGDAAWLREPGLPFWKPGWRQSLGHLGWRWILLTPIVLVVAVLVMMPFRPEFLQIVWMAGGKLILFSGAMAISAIAYAMTSAMRSRSEPFCIHCGYGLTGLPDRHMCPECGRPYTFALIAEYRRDPNWFIKRCKAVRTLPAKSAAFDAGKIRSNRKSRDGT